MNTIREALDGDEVVVGASVDTFAPSVVEVYGDLGLDFAWLDFEHAGPSPYDSTVFEEFTRAGELTGIELLVRLPSGDPHLVRKVLDAGVRTVLIPRVKTAEEVRSAVAAAYFEYDREVGDRGVAGGRASDYGASIDDYVDREDREVLVGAMVENATALDNLAEILSVPRLGFAFVGPADLSVSLGRPMATDHPEVQAAISEIRAACLDRDVPVGCIANSTTAAAAAVDEGYQVLRIGGDIGAVRSVLSDRLSGIR